MTWLGFRITGHALLEGMGVVPQGEVADLPIGGAGPQLVRRRYPQLGEDNVRDLLLSAPGLLGRVLGKQFRLVLR